MAACCLRCFFAESISSYHHHFLVEHRVYPSYLLQYFPAERVCLVSTELKPPVQISVVVQVSYFSFSVRFPVPSAAASVLARLSSSALPGSSPASSAPLSFSSPLPARVPF